MKVLLATNKPFASKAVEEIRYIIEDAGFTFETLENYTDKAQLILAIKEAHAVIVRSDVMDEEIIKHAPQLKIIVRAGAGFDNVDLAAATAHDICVMNTPGQNANAVAELIFGMLLYQMRNHFDGSTGQEIKDRRLGLFGFGHVARAVAKISSGFDMKLYAYSVPIEEIDQSRYNVTVLHSAKELFRHSEIISLHIPFVKETHQLINYELLACLPEDGIIINTARKEVINEDDLIRIMEERPKFQYITDVRPSKHEEFSARFPKTYLSTAKKAGAQTVEANFNAGLAAAQQVVRYLTEGDERCRVN